MPIHFTIQRDFITFVLQRWRVKFHIGFLSHGFTLHPLSRNHPSSLTSPQVISVYVSEEVATGRMTGPLVAPIRSIVHCSSLGLVPKGRNSGCWRMIVDLSFPQGRSVNDEIDPSLCSLTYASIDDTLQFITRLGTNTLLLKIDLKDSYRMVPVHTRDRHLLGVCWRDQAHIDQVLLFGLCSAPKLFTVVANAIGWALFQAGYLCTCTIWITFFSSCHQVAPTLILCSPTSMECWRVLVSQLHGTRQKDP